MKQIRLLVLDIDGVLTDGRESIGDPSAITKHISLQDLDGVTAAKRAGLSVAFITGEDGATIDRIGERFGVVHIRRGAKKKLPALQSLVAELGFSLEETCYVGDGDRDVPALSHAGLGLAPSNATPAAKSAAHRLLTRDGGNGAVAEAVRLLLRLREDASVCAGFERDLNRIVRESVKAHQRLLKESLPILSRVANEVAHAVLAGRKILLFGNGGSAANAQRFASDLTFRSLRERASVRAIALTADTTILTCNGDESQFDEMFARQVKALARASDVAVGFSAIGPCPNVVRGLEQARRLMAVTIGFTGANGDGLRNVCDLLFCAPSNDTSRVEELHLLACHAIFELLQGHGSAQRPTRAGQM